MKNIDKIILNVLNSIAILTPIILGACLNNLRFAVMGALGALIYNYYIPQNNHKGLVQILIVSSGTLISFSLVLFINQIPWITPIIIGILAALALFYTKRFHFIGPGPFFFIMIVSLAGTQKYIDLKTSITQIIYLLIGLLMAILSSLVGELLFYKLELPKLNFIPKHNNISQITSRTVLNSFFYGVSIFLAFYIGENLNLFNYYWVVVACAAVMKADNLPFAIERHKHYILGAMGGCAIAWVAISLPLEIWETVLVIAILNALIYWKINKNYLIGNLFTTPLAILLFKLISPNINDIAVLDRMLGIVIGTTIGLVSVYIMHYVLENIKDNN
ncbi:FUSC family protein [Lactococcus lactis]|nr:FUSC family protein [Lactococcus lactis]